MDSDKTGSQKEFYMGAAEVREIFGVSRQTLANWMNGVVDNDFPKPLARLKMGPVWTLSDLLRWKERQEEQTRKPIDFIGAEVGKYAGKVDSSDTPTTRRIREIRDQLTVLGKELLSLVAPAKEELQELYDDLELNPQVYTSYLLDEDLEGDPIWISENILEYRDSISEGEVGAKSPPQPMAPRSDMQIAQQILEDIKKHGVLEDRLEYDQQELQNCYQLTDEQAELLYKLIQEHP